MTVLVAWPMPCTRTAACSSNGTGHVVHVVDASGGGAYYYIVIVNGEVYDKMISTKPLSYSEQGDIAKGYQEALSNYGGIDEGM